MPSRRSDTQEGTAARVAVAIVLLGTLLGTPPIGHARDAPNVLLVNMTPDAHSTEASRQCVQGVVSRLRAGHEHIMHRQGETPTREQAGMTEGQPFMEWSKETLDRVGNRPFHEFVILVDCQPEQQKLNVRMSEGLFLELRNQPISSQLLQTVFEVVREQLWHTA